jgi:hypothetical protein
MRTIIKYKTVSGNSQANIDEKVNQMLSKGWQPWGSPMQFTSSAGEPYTQHAMVKYAD